ncbi:hypothetical protein RJ641_005026 [Dillenia turbinata]|uniref:Uncharacterized protein n=1 Tax=Dillenia turbinata TaxID=194707 RepID=A0AAN8VF57_9MAGN
MGKWDYRRRYYRRAFRKQPTTPNFDELSPEDFQNNVPSWEKQFCSVVGSVPWRKVVYTRKYMFYSTDILNWNDSAAEEAFNNAKRRFWLKSNGRPCDLSLPDPDMYVGKIDWNSAIDPKLILELESAYFCPDEAEKACRESNQRTDESHCTCGPEEHGVDLGSSPNPWECDPSPDTLKDKSNSWNQLDRHNNEAGYINKDNYWNCTNAQDVEVANEKAWVDGWKQSSDFEDPVNQSRNVENGVDPWDRCYKDAMQSVKDKRSANLGADAWVGDQWNNNISKRDSDNSDNPWNHSVTLEDGFLKDKGWGSGGHNSRVWKEGSRNANKKKIFNKDGSVWENNFGRNSGPTNKEQRYIGPNFFGQNRWHNHDGYLGSRTSGNFSTSNRNCRKREGSQQFISGYKSLRSQESENQSANPWTRRERKSVDFVSN